MDNVKSLHDTTKDVMETAAGTALAVKQLEMTSKRLMKVFKAVRNFGQMGSEVNNVKKMAKEIIIKRMSDPPSLKELSAEVDISLKNLKEGFKEIYGYTVYGFLLEYKMNIASKMLSTKNYNVNEVADHIGYSTSSHFINAFKNRFGTTPKKYLKSI